MTKKKILSMIIGTAMTVGLLAGCGTADQNDVSADSAAEVVQEAETVSEDETAVSDSVVENLETEEIAEDQNPEQEEKKTLVVYYSAQGHTVNFANAIAEELNADVFEIMPVEPYTEEDLNWTNDESRVSREHVDESLRDIALVTTDVENWETYDTVYIGYPIWWGIAAWPVDNFVKNNDFTGKTVIPFATSTSSGMGESGEILEGYAGTGNWLEGKRFQSNDDVANAREWAASIG